MKLASPIWTVCLYFVVGTSACSEAIDEAAKAKCEAARHCVFSSTRNNYRCEVGYTWEDTNDEDNYNCVLKPEPACVPKTCIELAANCGDLPDGCSNTLSCGVCTTGQSCGIEQANVCGMNPCIPTNCIEQSANCGSISDQCAGTLDCGSCPMGKICGEDTQANVCIPDPQMGINLDNEHLLRQKMYLGEDTACAINGNGALSCWGYDYQSKSSWPADPLNFVEISNGCTLDNQGRIQCWQTQNWTAPSGGPFKQISKRGSLLYAVHEDGSIHAFDSSSGAQRSDAPIIAGNNFTMVSLGTFVACALDSLGQISCWAMQEPFSDPYQLLTQIPTSEPFRQVQVGKMHICALAHSGAVRCWGISGGQSFSDYGQVTRAPTNGYFTALAVEEKSSCALTNVGQVKCWGLSYNDTITTVTIDPDIQTIAMGPAYVCMRKVDGTYFCEGEDGYGQSKIPEMKAERFQDISIDESLSVCGITIAGDALCIGTFGAHYNRDYQIVDWANIRANRPYRKITNWTPTRNGSNNKSNLCTVDANNRLRCWDGGSPRGSSHVKNGASNLTDAIYTDVDLGKNFACALDLDGRIVCWGANDLGQTSSSTGTGYTKVDAGQCTSYALSAKGKMVCWGYARRCDPQSEIRYKGVATNNSGVCTGQTLFAIQEDDTVRSWGLTNTMPLSGRYTDIASGRRTVCVVTTNGGIECWGSSSLNVAGKAPQGNNFASVYANEDQACALTTTGQLTCWGKVYIPLD